MFNICYEYQRRTEGKGCSLLSGLFFLNCNVVEGFDITNKTVNIASFRTAHFESALYQKKYHKTKKNHPNLLNSLIKQRGLITDEILLCREKGYHLIQLINIIISDT